jgi:alpha-tubulin suppressor-like RCC1 family protein/outer membrane protein assembly factor BamB
MKSRRSAYRALTFCILIVSAWLGAIVNVHAAPRPPITYTNRADATLSEGENGYLWTFTGKGVMSSPCLSADGLTLYVASGDRRLYAIDTFSGELKWTNDLKLPAPIFAAPIVDEDGRIYVGGSDGRLYGISDQGDFGTNDLRSLSTGDRAFSTPALGEDGTIYVGSAGNRLNAFFPDFARKWFYVAPDDVRTPIVADDGTILIVSGGFLRAVDEGGGEVSSFIAGSAIRSLPAVTEDGSMYFGSNDDRVYGLGVGGTTNDILWRFNTRQNVMSSPAIGADGSIYIASDNLRLYCLTTNGAVRWSVLTRAPVRSALSIGVDGTIYAGCEDRRLYAISSAGQILWTAKTRAPVRSSPALDAFGVVYFSSGRAVYAIETEAMADDSDEPAWQMFRKNAQHTARATECRPFLIAEPQTTNGAPTVDAPAGGPISFSVVVRGGAPVAYQWRLNGVEIDPADNRSATNATFTITSVSALDAGEYTVTAFNDCGEVESDIFTLNVDSPPIITSQPTNVFTLAGNTITLHVGAVGTPPLTYQWKKDGVPINPALNPTATNATFTITNAQPSDSSTNYSVMVMNVVDGVPQTNNSVSVTVQVFAITLSFADHPHPLGAGRAHSLAVLSDRTLWAWGLNNFGQLGDGNSGLTGTNFTLRSTPQLIGSNGTVSTNAVWVSISGGSRGNDPATNQPGGFSLGIQTNGSLWAWGLNDRGQLGIGSTNLQRVAIRVGADTNWVQVEAGAAHAIGLKRDGTIWTWGANEAGQLGLDSTNRNSLAPVRVGEDSAWVEVRAGGHFSLARRADGTIWAWGTNSHGQLGIGVSANSGANSLRRAPVMVGTNSDWAAISAGAFHSLGLKSNGTIWAWGRNHFGQLGLGIGFGDGRDGSNTNQPGRIGTESDWAAIEAGTSHSFAIKTDGRLFGWGANFFGQLGNGEMGLVNSTNSANKLSPVPVATDKTWRLVDASDHSLGITTDGSIWAWGLNNFGQVGDGTGGDGTRNNNRSTPVLLTFSANTNNLATNPPVIFQQPVGQVVNEMATVSFAVSAGGSEPLVYQWYFNSNVISLAANTTAMNATLTITNVTSTNAGFYHVTLTNNSGQVTSTVARLTVTTTSGAPVIVQQPQSISAGSNTTSGFAVSAQGAPPLFYRWRFNSNPINPSRAVSTNTTLILTNVSGADQGFYDVIVSNAVGTVASTPALLTVTNAPSGPFPLGPASDESVERILKLGAIRFGESGAEIPILEAPAEVRTLVLEYKDALSDAEWKPLSTNDASALKLFDPSPPADRPRFYRVRAE